MSGKISQYTEALSVANDDFFDTFVDESSKKSATVVSHLLPILDAWHD
mgnify:CR=1 FL=1